MSMLLADLDDAAWEVRVSPPFKGTPMFSVEPGARSDESRLNQGLMIALGALNRMCPGPWRKDVQLDADSGYVLLLNRGSHRAGRAA
jgi:hypothetical protein